MPTYNRFTEAFPDLKYETKSSPNWDQHKLSCSKWTVSFYSREAFACCGTQEIHSFSILDGDGALAIPGDIDKEAWKAIEAWFKEILPIYGVHNFMIGVEYADDDSYSELMNELYSRLKKMGTTLSSFQNVNGYSILHLIQFTPPPKEDGDD
jgi:hypothetical protein